MGIDLQVRVACVASRYATALKVDQVAIRQRPRRGGVAGLERAGGAIMPMRYLCQRRCCCGNAVSGDESRGMRMRVQKTGQAGKGVGFLARPRQPKLTELTWSWSAQTLKSLCCGHSMRLDMAAARFSEQHGICHCRQCFL